MLTTFDSARLNGIYYGTVLKHLAHGRCKIYIPVAYPEEYKDNPDMLPSARQASPIFTGCHNGNGMFSYPNIGSTVVCMFINGDANTPIYFATLLGGDRAFGQYSIVKPDYGDFNSEGEAFEDVSNKHLMTNAKARMEWFEDGKISAIVEDPIRTDCSVDFDTYEKYEDNIETDDKHKSTISNDILKKIKDNKLSNIDCQVVLDNNGGTHGKLSTSTHWFNIYDEEDEKKGTHLKGTLSIDNHSVLHNHGIIGHQTKRTIKIDEETNKQTTLCSDACDNSYMQSTEGTYFQLLSTQHDIQSTNKVTGLNINDKLTASVIQQHDVHGIEHISADIKLQNDTVDSNGSTKLTNYLSNAMVLSNDGLIALSSNVHVDLAKSSRQSGSLVKKEDISSVFQSDGRCNTLVQTISSLNEVNDSSGTKIVKLSNSLDMKSDGRIYLGSQTNTYKLDQNQTTTILTAYSGNYMDVNDGDNTQEGGWKRSLMSSGSTKEVDNQFLRRSLSKNNASLQEVVVAQTKIDGSPTVDFKYNKLVKSKDSTSTLIIQDNITKNKVTYGNDVRTGKSTMHITNTESGMMCMLTFDSKGVMTVQTTDKLDISTTNSVTVTTPQITMNGVTTINGATTINSTLHVTSQTTIDADATIGGKSFLGHMHGNGNLGAPTTPPL